MTNLSRRQKRQYNRKEKFNETENNLSDPNSREGKGRIAMTRKVELTSDNNKLCEKICSISGQMVTMCDQCGTCSGSCPLATEMDINPSEMMKMAQLGMEEVLEAKAIWLCASCYTCAVRCPRGLDLSKVAEALRQIKLRQAEDHIDIKKMTIEEMEALPQIALISACRKFTG